ncbi:MAG: rane protein [Pseudonocardiales bacterium]|jgi:membrane protein|nr:rane protein [Pseudonocardiales bacterium]
MTQGRLARLKSGAGARWAGLKERHLWLRHVVSAWDLLRRNHGNEYAAAITYFSFLALFPLILLAASITGFVLHSHPELEQDFFARITKEVPGSFGTTITEAVQKAIESRRGVGLVGLVGVLLAGLGWINNLRGAIDGVWGRPPAQVNFLKARITNLFVLAGLGLCILVSLALTVIGTSLTDQILSALSLDDLPGSHALLKLLGIAIAVVGDMVIFWWLLIRLPQVEVPQRIAFRGALLASVGFEVLKIVGTYTIAHTANNPTAGPFAGIIAVLIWIQLVARYMLFACAWTATLTVEDRVAMANRMPVMEPEPIAADEEAGSTITPAAVGVSLVGAGAVAGAVATLAITRGRARPKRRS